jgi:hypothetical protein
VDWSKHNCNRHNKKLAPEYIKEALEYIKDGYIVEGKSPCGQVDLLKELDS